MAKSFWKSSRRVAVILLMSGMLWGGCRCVEPVYQNVPTSSNTGESDSIDDTHIFQVGELIKFTYHGPDGTPEFREERINQEGILSLPGIGSVAAAGRTPREVQQELQKKYPRYFGSYPRVYFVGGQVKNPGAKPYLGITTVTAAIQTAGDFTDFANKKKVVLIRSSGSRETVNLTAITDPTQDPPVYPGDRIEVSRRWGFSD